MMLRTQETLDGEIIVDSFAGGGGASTGIELALGRIVNAAINHDPAAIRMHEANHPYTEHYQASVWDVDPEAVCRGRPVALAWFSPDCKHFSKAKGAALVDRRIRGLAWIALRWAAKVRPRVIILENVMARAGGSRLWCADYQTSAGADCPLRRTCDRLAGAHTRPARQCGSAQRKTAAMAQRRGDHRLVAAVPFDFFDEG